MGPGGPSALCGSSGAPQEAPRGPWGPRGSLGGSQVSLGSQGRLEAHMGPWGRPGGSHGAPGAPGAPEGPQGPLGAPGHPRSLSGFPGPPGRPQGPFGTRMATEREPQIGPKMGAPRGASLCEIPLRMEPHFLNSDDFRRDLIFSIVGNEILKGGGGLPAEVIFQGGHPARTSCAGLWSCGGPPFVAHVGIRILIDKLFKGRRSRSRFGAS